MKKAYPFLMLFARLILFAAFQGLIAFIFFAKGHDSPWTKSEGYWIISGLLTNVVVFILLLRLFKLEGAKYFEGLKFIPETWWKDLLITLGILVIAAPLSYFPNIFLSGALLGSEEAATALLFRPLPSWVLIAGVFWAVTQGIVELPTYFSYIMPRIEKSLQNGWLAWAIASFFLALQHIAIPLIFNLDFILWRFGMFLPFAFLLGMCIKLRPRLFPYLMIMHALMDIGTIAMFF